MEKVRAKKHLGQHFLVDENIAQKIVNSLTNVEKPLIEIGPGMGVLTKYLIQKHPQFSVCEIDTESVEYLKEKYPKLNIIEGDFLKLNLQELYNENIAIIGNFPYNISSQIMFAVYDNREIVDEVVGMFQREVAKRLASPPGNKDYGILSVLLQAHYDIEYLIDVPPGVFSPPPKVNSGVIRLIRKENFSLDCDERLFKNVVKATFNQRRKTIRNSIKSLNVDVSKLPDKYLKERPEQLSVADFVEICNQIKH